MRLRAVLALVALATGALGAPDPTRPALLTAVGVVVFGERLSFPEVVGLMLALASLVLLVRFA